TAPVPPPTASPPRAASSRIGSNAITLDEPAIELPRQESFKLIDAGRGSKALLRYALAPQTSSFHVETRMSSRQLAGGAFTQPVVQPATRDGFAITIAADQPGKLTLRALPGTSAARSAAADAYLALW